MRHPSEYYARYLLVDSGVNVDLADINEDLLNKGLLPFSGESWDRLGNEVSIPADVPDSLEDPGFVSFLKKQKIHLMYVGCEASKRIFAEMFSDGGSRQYQHDLHILIMGDLPDDVIAEKINWKYRLTNPITLEMVQFYRHYFWNRNLLSSPEWVHLLDPYPYKDSLLAPLMCGEQQALYRAGMNPKYDRRAALRDSHRQITYRLQNLSWQSDADSNKLFVHLSREQRNIYALMEGEGGGYEDKVKEARQWIMENREVASQAIYDLVGPGGTYSGDGKEDKSCCASNQDDETKANPSE